MDTHSLCSYIHSYLQLLKHSVTYKLCLIILLVSIENFLLCYNFLYSFPLLFNLFDIY